MILMPFIKEDRKFKTFKYLMKKQERLYPIIAIITSLFFSFGAYQWTILKQKKFIQQSNILSCFSETGTNKCNGWRLRFLSLQNLNIQNKTFTRCICEGSVLKKIKIKESDFRQNNFRLSFFQDVLFFKTNFQKSSFEGAIIKNTIFENINLNGVIFKFTTFINVEFKNVDMTQAIFIGSRFKKSTYDKNTKLPFSTKTAKELGLRKVSNDKI